LAQYLQHHGSQTAIDAVAFERAHPPKLRVKVRSTQTPSETTLLRAAHRGLYIGDTWFHAQSGAQDMIFYHGTAFEDGMNAMIEGRFRVDDRNHPIGHYTALTQPESYDRGCVIECSTPSLLLSLKATKRLMQEHPCVVPEGAILRINRSTKEYVHNPNSVRMETFVLPFELLTTHLGLQLPPVPAYESVPHLALRPKAAAHRRPAPRTPPIPPSWWSSASSTDPVAAPSTAAAASEVAAVLNPPPSEDEQTWGSWGA